MSENQKISNQLTDAQMGDRWREIDKLEANLPKKLTKKRRGGMKFWRIFGDTTGQIVLTILSIIWLIPFIYLIIQSFRAEPGAFSPTFFPRGWTTISVCF